VDAFDTPGGWSDAPAPWDATEAVAAARSGLKNDVQNLVDRLPTARLFVALSRPIDGVTPGIEVELGDDLTLAPHLLLDSDDIRYVALFTAPDLLEGVAARMGWQTADGPLEFCALPAPAALEMALQLVDGESVMGLLVNAMDDAELMLTRNELASSATGRALPLVGYVSQIPHRPAEKLLVSELAEPIAEPVIQAIERVLGGSDRCSGYVLRQTFNAERDVEPHLTLNLLSDDPDADLVPLAEALASELEGKLPPPGYIDILFNDSTLR
jgi:hypothetical protein